MKSSVLDRINAASVRDIDDMLAPSKASSGRIRNKIAKLADTVSPLDVETLDLEFLVKTFEWENVDSLVLWNSK